jgi:choline dehydrogenase-like flavoprotein
MGAEEIHTDVCVIGAGPAGITVARELQAQRIRTCLVESGGRDVVNDVQKQGRGESDGYPIAVMDHSRVRAFGGTLRHPRIPGEGWAARTLDPIDFEARAGVPESGWPITRADLDGFYLRAVRTVGIRSQDDAETWWREHASRTAQVVADGDLEATVFQFPVPDFKDAWVTLDTSEYSQVLLLTRVVDLQMDKTGNAIERVLAVRGVREPVEIVPRIVVLATGGIENARLLLTADGGRGLGNEHDLVGRYFSERLSFLGGQVVVADQKYVDDMAMLHRPPGSEAGGGIRVTDDVQRARGLLNCAFFLMPRPQAVTRASLRSLSTLRKARVRRPLLPGVPRHVGRALGAPLPLAEIALGRVVSRPRTLLLRTQGEQTPNRESRVTLASRRDDLGIPLARLTWQIRDEDFEAIKTAAGYVDNALRANGIGHVEWTGASDGSTLVEGNHHHMGTTRMHRDPRHGVVDPDGRVHSVANLYVAGSSVFPTFGASNPTLTIIALAHRLADHISDRLRSG